MGNTTERKVTYLSSKSADDMVGVMGDCQKEGFECMVLPKLRTVANGYYRIRVYAHYNEIKNIVEKYKDMVHTEKEYGVNSTEFAKGGSVYEYYEVDYYATIGEHGSAGDYRDFSEAYLESMKFKKQEKSAKRLDELEYIGVSGSGNDFAVVYVTESYIKRADEKMFQSKEAYESWKAVAEETLKTGVAHKGKYEKEYAAGGGVSTRLKQGQALPEGAVYELPDGEKILIGKKFWVVGDKRLPDPLPELTDDQRLLMELWVEYERGGSKKESHMHSLITFLNNWKAVRTFEKGGEINKLPADTQEQVKLGKVTYRGTGLGGDFKIKVHGKEYLVTHEKLEELGGPSKIKFDAPHRSEYESGGQLTDYEKHKGQMVKTKQGEFLLFDYKDLSSPSQAIARDILMTEYWPKLRKEGKQSSKTTDYWYEKSGHIFGKKENTEYAQGGEIPERMTNTAHTDQEALKRLSENTNVSEEIRNEAAATLSRIKLEVKDEPASPEELSAAIVNTQAIVRETEGNEARQGEKYLYDLEKGIVPVELVESEEAALPKVEPMGEEAAIELVGSWDDQKVANFLMIPLEEVNVKTREDAANRLVNPNQFEEGGEIERPATIADIKEGAWFKTPTGRIGQAYAVGDGKRNKLFGNVDLFFEGPGNLYDGNGPSGIFSIDKLKFIENHKKFEVGGEIESKTGVMLDGRDFPITRFSSIVVETLTKMGIKYKGATVEKTHRESGSPIIGYDFYTELPKFDDGNKMLKVNYSYDTTHKWNPKFPNGSVWSMVEDYIGNGIPLRLKAEDTDELKEALKSQFTGLLKQFATGGVVAGDTVTIEVPKESIVAAIESMKENEKTQMQSTQDKIQAFLNRTGRAIWYPTEHQGSHKSLRGYSHSIGAEYEMAEGGPVYANEITLDEIKRGRYIITTWKKEGKRTIPDKSIPAFVVKAESKEEAYKKAVEELRDKHHVKVQPQYDEVEAAGALSEYGAGGKIDDGKKYHIDTYGVSQHPERVVDDVTVISEAGSGSMVLVYSPYLQANVLVPKSELKEIDGGGEYGKGGEVKYTLGAKKIISKSENNRPTVLSIDGNNAEIGTWENDFIGGVYVPMSSIVKRFKEGGDIAGGTGGGDDMPIGGDGNPYTPKSQEQLKSEYDYEQSHNPDGSSKNDSTEAIALDWESNQPDGDLSNATYTATYGSDTLEVKTKVTEDGSQTFVSVINGAESKTGTKYECLQDAEDYISNKYPGGLSTSTTDKNTEENTAAARWDAMTTDEKQEWLIDNLSPGEYNELVSDETVNQEFYGLPAEIQIRFENAVDFSEESAPVIPESEELWYIVGDSSPMTYDEIVEKNNQLIDEEKISDEHLLRIRQMDVDDIADSYLGNIRRVDIESATGELTDEERAAAEQEYKVSINNYNGLTPAQVWNDAWSLEQRKHFLIDHTNEMEESNDPYFIDTTIQMEYSELPQHIKDEVFGHINQGQYAEGGEVGTKTYYTQGNVGKTRYLINYHDGVKKYSDGSDFYDIQAFQNKEKFKKAIEKLKSEGYTERIFAKGGPVTNKTPEQIWAGLDRAERMHFIEYTDKEHTPASIDSIAKMSYRFLPADVKASLLEHKDKYAKGGSIWDKAKSAASSVKSAAKKGYEGSKKGYAKAKKATKDKIHDTKENIALDVLHDTRDNAKTSADSRTIHMAENIVEAEYAKGGDVKSNSRLKIEGSNIHPDHKKFCGDKGGVIQSIIFDKEKFNILQARKWLKKHDYKYAKVDKTVNTYRFRQLSPVAMEKDSYKTIHLGKDTGITASLACPQKKYLAGGAITSDCGCH